MMSIKSFIQAWVYIYIYIYIYIDAPDINMHTNVFFCCCCCCFFVVCILLNQIPAPQMNPDDFLQTVFLWERCTNIRYSTTLIFYGKTSSLTTDYVFFFRLESMESSRNTCKYQEWFSCFTCWTESVAGMTQSLFTSLWLDQCAQ